MNPSVYRRFCKTPDENRRLGSGIYCPGVQESHRSDAGLVTEAKRPLEPWRRFRYDTRPSVPADHKRQCTEMLATGGHSGREDTPAIRDEHFHAFRHERPVRGAVDVECATEPREMKYGLLVASAVLLVD